CRTTPVASREHTPHQHRRRTATWRRKSSHERVGFGAGIGCCAAALEGPTVMVLASIETAGADGRLFAAPQIAHETLADGSLVIRSARRLGAIPRAVGVWLEKWAAEAPDRVFLAARDEAGGWRRLTYRQAERDARAIGQALLERGLSPAKPILILADN